MEFKLPRLVAELLYRKGIKTSSEAQEFFNPSMENLYDPFLFPDMEKAVQRILKAIDNKEKITIYGDYDVDGTTATALLYRLKSIGANIDFLFPPSNDRCMVFHLTILVTLWEMVLHSLLLI
jgi:single-stranded-DNA-specific exonuclease